MLTRILWQRKFGKSNLLNSKFSIFRRVFPAPRFDCLSAEKKLKIRKFFFRPVTEWAGNLIMRRSFAGSSYRGPESVAAWTDPRGKKVEIINKKLKTFLRPCVNRVNFLFCFFFKLSDLIKGPGRTRVVDESRISSRQSSRLIRVQLHSLFIRM